VEIVRGLQIKSNVWARVYLCKVDNFRLLRGRTHGKPAGMRDERQSFCFLCWQKTGRIGIELFPAIAFENVSAKTLTTLFKRHEWTVCNPKPLVCQLSYQLYWRPH
jgi:hypothetical protein